MFSSQNTCRKLNFCVTILEVAVENHNFLLAERKLNACAGTHRVSVSVVVYLYIQVDCSLKNVTLSLPIGTKLWKAIKMVEDYITCCIFIRQTQSQPSTSMRFVGDEACCNNTRHMLVWQGTKFVVQNFTFIGAEMWEYTPKTVKISNFSHKFTSQGRNVCSIFTKFSAFVHV